MSGPVITAASSLEEALKPIASGSDSLPKVEASHEIVLARSSQHAFSTEHYYKGPCVIQIGPTGGKMHLEWRASENTIAQGNSASQAIEWVRLEVPESGCILCIPAGCRHRYVFSDSTPVSATLVADDFEPPQISSITEDTAFVRSRIVELCQLFYTLGWVSGTGGGVSIRDGSTIFIAPSGVQKERIEAKDIFECSASGQVLRAPESKALNLSACAPLFMLAFRLRGAGAVLHSHSIHAVMASLMHDEVFQVTELEMIKGIAGHGYYDTLEIPIIENTAHECDLADSMEAAMHAYPKACAVLVRRHGVYIWGSTWEQAKTQAECLHFLFEAAFKMRELGVQCSKGTERKRKRS